MNHDPLCPKQLAPQLRTSAKHLWCECDLIARVRADEQAKIAAEFAQQPFIPHTGLWLTYRQIEGLTVLMRRDERRQARQRVEVYADDTHPAHGKREACPRCDITAVLRHVAATVIGGES